VEDPSKYGVIISKENGEIERFVEKPQQWVGNKINAGLYLLNVSVIDRIEMKPTSIEREIFPKMAADNNLFVYALDGYWMDIGQPKDYLIGMCMHLGSLRKRSAGLLAAAGPGIRGDVLVHESAQIAPGAVLGPNVVVGPGCIVEEGARVVRSTLLQGVRVRAHALVSSSIVGWGSTVGQWARVEGSSVLGEDVQVADETIINGALVLPHKSLRESIYAPGAIIM
jgi:mannose-1-phosphate guanylyltransferase